MTGSRPHCFGGLERFLGARSAALDAVRRTTRLEFAAFSVKSRVMTSRGDGIFGFRRRARLWPALVLMMLLPVVGWPANAQWFRDRSPAGSPGGGPDPGGAVRLGAALGGPVALPPPAPSVP